MSTEDTVAYCNNTLESVRRLQGSFCDLLDVHSYRNMPNGTIGGWLADFMKLFPAVAFQWGWRLSTKYRDWGIGGRLGFFVKGPLGIPSRHVHRHIRLIDDSPKAALDWAMFDYAMTQIGLSWHGLYAQREFITDISEFAKCYKFKHVRWETIMHHIKDIEAFRNYDFEPMVRLEGKGRYVVEYSTFSPFVGFEKNVVRVKDRHPINNPQAERVVVFPYKCLLHY